MDDRPEERTAIAAANTRVHDDVRSRARWAIIALAAVALLDVVAFFSDLAEYRLLGRSFTLEEADANDTRQTIIGLIQAPLLIVAA